MVAAVSVFLSFPHGNIGLPAVSDCVISWSYSLTFCHILTPVYYSPERQHLKIYIVL